MYLLSRSIPLVIALPVDEDASQDFLKKHLYEDEAAYYEAYVIADRLSKVPDIESSDTSLLAAVSVSDVIISHNQAELEQWVDQYSEGNTYWFFSLRNGKALPLRHKDIQTLDSPLMSDLMAAAVIIAIPLASLARAVCCVSTYLDR